MMASTRLKIHKIHPDQSADTTHESRSQLSQQASGEGETLTAAQLQAAHLRFLALPLLQDVLAWQAGRYRGQQEKASTPPTCFICYAWPASISEEIADPHVRVLQLVDDLHLAGINPHIDIEDMTDETQRLGTRCYTDMQALIDEGLANSRYALVLASESYHQRAANTQTTTYTTVERLQQKLAEDQSKDFVIPLLWSGERFPSGFPTMGGKLATIEQYFTDLPGITAKLLGIENDPAWQEQAETYQAAFLSVIKESQTAQLDEEAIKETQQRYDSEQAQLKRRLNLRIQQIPPKVRRELDGALIERVALLNQRLGQLAQDFPINQRDSELRQALQPINDVISGDGHHAEKAFTEALGEFSQAWQDDSPRAMVLEGPQDHQENCGKRDWLRYQEQRSWQQWLEHHANSVDQKGQEGSVNTESHLQFCTNLNG